MKKVYLAGGFHSGWQDEVYRVLKGCEILDPRKHGLTAPKDYTEWDLEALQRCDYVLANMEETNPGGYSLALEVGYAKALGKQIIVVDQITDPEIKKYFEMVRQVANIVFNRYDEALAYLKKAI